MNASARPSRLEEKKAAAIQRLFHITTGLLNATDYFSEASSSPGSRADSATFPRRSRSAHRPLCVSPLGPDRPARSSARLSLRGRIASARYDIKPPLLYWVGSSEANYGLPPPSIPPPSIPLPLRHTCLPRSDSSPQLCCASACVPSTAISPPACSCDFCFCFLRAARASSCDLPA